ncbi:MAG: alpha/beta fold hydrolase [Akkermansiaceae bacterium]
MIRFLFRRPRKSIFLFSVMAAAGVLAAPYAQSVKANRITPENEHVILVHGMARSASTMNSMAETLKKAGYTVTILDYPSRKKTIRDLADGHLTPAVQECRNQGATKIHFVTHSLGGILLRDLLSRHQPPELGRVVMLAPPNQGSEVVDCIGHWPVFKMINGPAGGQLGTAKESPPLSLGKVDYPVGIIAGDRSINLINSGMIPGPDDGKVSIENTKLEGMTDHTVLHCTHPMIMKRPDAIQLTLRFLQEGKFKETGSED